MRVLLLMLGDDGAERSLHVLDGGLGVRRIAFLARAELVKRNVEQPRDVLDARRLGLDELRVAVRRRQRRVFQTVVQHSDAEGVVRAAVDALPVLADAVFQVDGVAVLVEARFVRKVGLGREHARHLSAVFVVVALVPLRLQRRLDGFRAAPEVAHALEAVGGKCLVVQHILRPELAVFLRLRVNAYVPQLRVAVEQRHHVPRRDRKQLHRHAPLVAQNERVG